MDVAKQEAHKANKHDIVGFDVEAAANDIADQIGQVKRARNGDIIDLALEDDEANGDADEVHRSANNQRKKAIFLAI